MTAARVTPARARQLGLPGVPATTSRSRRGTRRTLPAKECADTFCCTCRDRFGRPVDEDRHFAAHPGHARYGCDISRIA